MNTPVALQERINRLRDESPRDERDGSKARVVWRRMSDVEPRQVESLWPGYLVKRKLNLLAGYGGVGKDQLMADIIARLSTRRPFPSTMVAAEPTRTLILAAEDDAHEDWRPRLDANSADVEEVLILDGIAEGDGPLRWVDVKRHMELIEELVRDQQIDLVYISPLSSYMPGVTRNDAGDVRDTLGYVQRLIDNTGITVIATLHIGKATDRPGALRILGSVEFVNAARNVLAVNDLPDEYQPDDVLEDPTRGRRKVLEVVKANSIIPGPPLSFSRPLDAAVQWHGQAPVGFDESFRAPEPKGAKQEEAEEWLFDFLKGGMQPVSKVQQAGKDAGIAARTLRRAREALKVESYRVDFQGPFYMRLPTDPSNRDHVDSSQDVVEVAKPDTTSNPDQVAPIGSVDEVGRLPNLGQVQELSGQSRVTGALVPALSTSLDMGGGQGSATEQEVVPRTAQHCAECGQPTTGPGEIYCPVHIEGAQAADEWSMTL